MSRKKPKKKGTQEYTETPTAIPLILFPIQHRVKSEKVVSPQPIRHRYKFLFFALCLLFPCQGLDDVRDQQRKTEEQTPAGKQCLISNQKMRVEMVEFQKSGVPFSNYMRFALT